MAQHNEVGNWGEACAVQHLKEQGYTIVERDWRVGTKDIDIIALTHDERIMVFIEVKTRQSDDVADPTEAVTIKKMRSIASCANMYLKLNNITAEPRFDIITIVGHSAADAVVQHIEDAFNPCLL